MSSGAASAADAASQGQPQPLSVRLIGRGSLAGAVIVVAVALLYAVLLPAVADVMSAPPPPQTIEIGAGATVTTSSDWSVSASHPGITTLTQGGATLAITTPHASDLHPAQAIATVTEQWVAQAEADGQGIVAPQPRAFTTTAGDDAATVTLQEPLQTRQAWAVSDGTQQVIILLTAPPAAWESTNASAQSLVRSLRFATPEAP
ncbi:hypothetical protein [Demequina rhizosphaerae]|uniref:hypothetical protein n=1 Tax=Demequina rhizosphaerae TaxID=1638985 RepID=UPI000784B0A4|nr:hypothetical protein [Demequina rhizosphaerae]